MAVLDLFMAVAHMVFAGLWTGSVIFVSVGVLPAASAGELRAPVMGTIAERLQWVSRISALALFITGGPLTSSQYTLGELLGTTRGYGVIAMIVLWLVLIALVEVAGSRARDLTEGTASDLSEGTRTLFHGAAVVSGLLLVVSGYLVTG